MHTHTFKQQPGVCLLQASCFASEKMAADAEGVEVLEGRLVAMHSRNGSAGWCRGFCNYRRQLSVGDGWISFTHGSSGMKKPAGGMKERRLVNTRRACVGFLFQLHVFGPTVRPRSLFPFHRLLVGPDVAAAALQLQ